MKYFAGIIIAALIFLSSCAEKKEEKVPAEVVPIEKMASVVAAIHLSDAMLLHNNLVMKQEEKKDLNFNVFRENNIKREAYYSSLHYYSHHPDKLKEIYKLALEKLNAMKE